MAITSKLLITVLALWAVLMPDEVSSVLEGASSSLLKMFDAYYVYVVTIFLVFCIGVAAVPAIGRQKLGRVDDRPEFSRFSWFSMMFGAGMGIGLMIFSTAEPLWHMGENPEIIGGHIEPYTHHAIQSAFRYSFLHYGLHPWGIYVVTGLCMAYFTYRYHLPLTIRSALIPLFGKHLGGYAGHLLDITAIIATLLGIAVTIGYGINQLVAGLNEIVGFAQVMPSETGAAPAVSTAVLLWALFLVMFLSIISAATGLGRGIRVLSNLNLGLSCLLLLVFLIPGPLFYLLKLYGRAIIDYLSVLPVISIEVFESGTAAGSWQKQGTIFYWAWWIAFAPFVGLFLARISKGRTIREFVLGAMLAPAAMCFVWIALLGGTAVHLELSGVAGGRIIHAPVPAQLFETLKVLLYDEWFNDRVKLVFALTVTLILTFLITSADSGVLVLNTIMTGGRSQFDIKHTVIWGLILTAIIAALLITGDGSLEALQQAVIIGALPFSLVMILMCLALIKDMLCPAKISGA